MTLASARMVTRTPARDVLDGIRRAVREHPATLAELAALRECIERGDSWRTMRERAHSPAISDPTAAMALQLADGEAEAEEQRLVSRAEAEEEAIGRGLRLVDGCRAAWGDAMAETLELWVIDAPERERMSGSRVTWAMMAEELGVSEATAYRRRDALLDWVDDVGMAAACAGWLTKAGRLDESRKRAIV